MALVLNMAMDRNSKNKTDRLTKIVVILLVFPVLNLALIIGGVFSNILPYAILLVYYASVIGLLATFVWQIYARVKFHRQFDFRRLLKILIVVFVYSLLSILFLGNISVLFVLLAPLATFSAI